MPKTRHRRETYVDVQDEPERKPVVAAPVVPTPEPEPTPVPVAAPKRTAAKPCAHRNRRAIRTRPPFMWRCLDCGAEWAMR